MPLKVTVVSVDAATENSVRYHQGEVNCLALTFSRFTLKVISTTIKAKINERKKYTHR
jgi:hypothetical protein